MYYENKDNGSKFSADDAREWNKEKKGAVKKEE
jgi:hypothetical protein